MSAAVVMLVESVVTAINAASLAGSFSGPVIATEDYGLTLEFEGQDKWRIAVQPGPSRNFPATLDSGFRDEVSARVVLWRNMAPGNTDGIKAGLQLIQDVCDVAASVEGDDLAWIGTSPELGPNGEANTAYDQQRLNNDGVFHSAFLVNFDAMR